MFTNVSLLQPASLLLLWTMIMWLWMYITRIPAIKASGMQMDANRPNGEQMAELPATVRWKADNFNHLHEQPTLFYAVVVILTLAGAATGVNVFFAWCYVLLRVIHSVFQSLVNKIEIRFVIFLASSICLWVLIINSVLTLF